MRISLPRWIFAQVTMIVWEEIPSMRLGLLLSPVMSTHCYITVGRKWKLGGKFTNYSILLNIGIVDIYEVGRQKR